MQLKKGVVCKSMQNGTVNKVFDPIINLGFDNLIVGGCSYSHQTGDVPISWPYYLRDLAGFKKVFLCSVPGAGNYHISQSIIWGIENLKPDPTKTLVAIMWSGYNREDEIFDASAIDHTYPWNYKYTDNVYHGLTGGTDLQNSWSNVNMFFFRDITKLKSKESRAVENSIWMISLKRYLDALGYKSIFMHYLDPKIPNRTDDFIIKDFLPEKIWDTLTQITNNIQDPYSFCLKHLLLSTDEFHPSPDGYLKWTREILLPYLKNNIMQPL